MTPLVLPRRIGSGELVSRKKILGSLVFLFFFFPKYFNFFFSLFFFLHLFFSTLQNESSCSPPTIRDGRSVLAKRFYDSQSFLFFLFPKTFDISLSHSFF